MEMATLMEFLDSRRPDQMSKRDFAQNLGLTSSALELYAKNRRGMKVETLRGIASYFKSIGDEEALSTLASYALDTPGVFTPSN